MNNLGSTGKEINKHLDYLSKAIFRIKLTKAEELKNNLNDDRLDAINFAMANLAAAIINCLIIAIELGTRKIKR